MKTAFYPIRTLLLIMLTLSTYTVANGSPCFWKKKSYARAGSDEPKVFLHFWMFDSQEWETNEQVHLQSWMYVIQPYCELNDYTIQQWMWDISQGWISATNQTNITLEAFRRQFEDEAS